MKNYFNNGFPGTEIIHPSMLVRVEFKYFHVFTDGKDQCFNLEKDFYNEAQKKAFEYKNELIEQGHQNIRVYYVHEMQDPRDLEMMQIEESCIFSLGNYPS